MAIDAITPRTRRALLCGTLGGAAALLATALGRPLTGEAADGDVIRVGEEAMGTRATRITSSNGHGFDGLSSDTRGAGVVGRATAPDGESFGVIGASESPDGIGVSGRAMIPGGSPVGVFGETTDGIGVRGYAVSLSGPTSGVEGQSDSIDGIGVLGWATSTEQFAHGIGVAGTSDGMWGRGVEGQATSTAGDARGVSGSSASTEGTGVAGFALAPSGHTYGVTGKSDSPDGTGVGGFATADGGRGGEFRGQAAQIRLRPSALSRPISGQAGDLFVDHEGALWFCKGDTTWKQLA